MLWRFSVAGRPKTALLFWVFGDFRYGMSLFMVILVIYKYKNSYKLLLNVRLAVDHLYGGKLVSMMVSFCAALFSSGMSWMRFWT